MRDERQQPGPPAGAAALDRPHGDIEHLGGLGDGIALHIHQDQSGALLDGKLGEGGNHLPVHVIALNGCRSGLVRFQELLHALGVIGERRTAGSCLTRSVQAGIDRDAVQPCGNRGLAAKGVRSTVGGDEGVLYGVGSLFAIAERP
jgi:hypothetical protein